MTLCNQTEILILLHPMSDSMSIQQICHTAGWQTEEEFLL